MKGIQLSNSISVDTDREGVRVKSKLGFVVAIEWLFTNTKGADDAVIL